jgi:hypothetical protein
MIKYYQDRDDLKALSSIVNESKNLLDGRSVLQIGARVGGDPGWIKMFNMFREHGYTIFNVLEAWKFNADRLKWSFLDRVVCGDVRDISNLILGTYDVTVFWHGLEHLSKTDALTVIPKIEALSTRAVIFGMPHGEWKRVKLNNDNPYEEHLSAWYPGELEQLGYNVHVFGEADKNTVMFGIKEIK